MKVNIVFEREEVDLAAEAATVKWGSEAYVEIDRKNVQSVEVRKKVLSKKSILTLTDGSGHMIDYGAMKIDKMVGDIESC